MKVTRHAFLVILTICLVSTSIPCSADSKYSDLNYAHLASCDPAVVHSAVEEMLRDSKMIEEPLMLFQAALGERMIGNKEEAAFLYLSARLRTSRQILFEKGDRPQLLSVMMMTVGPLILPSLALDPDMTVKVVKRVIAWDRATPDPYRDRQEAKSPEIKKKLSEIDAGLKRITEQIRSDPAQIAKARIEDEQAERQIKIMNANRCGPGTLDPVDIEEAIKNIKSQAEDLVRNHPLVLARANSALKYVNVASYKIVKSRLPSRLTVSVTPKTTKTFYAEIDAETSITPDRKLGPVKLSLACITDLWLGQRQTSWKDVCQGDTNAIKPTP